MITLGSGRVTSFRRRIFTASEYNGVEGNCGVAWVDSPPHSTLHVFVFGLPNVVPYMRYLPNGRSHNSDILKHKNVVSPKQYSAGLLIL